MRVLAPALSAAVMIACACVPARAEETPKVKPAPPPFENARYWEDYNDLLDPANRTGTWWEELKVIPVSPTAPARPA